MMEGRREGGRKEGEMEREGVKRRRVGEIEIKGGTCTGGGGGGGGMEEWRKRVIMGGKWMEEGMKRGRRGGKKGGTMERGGKEWRGENSPYSRPSMMMAPVEVATIQSNSSGIFWPVSTSNCACACMRWGAESGGSP